MATVCDDRTRVGWRPNRLPRTLTTYPSPSHQGAYLGLALLTAVALARASEVSGAVATQIMSDLHMSFARYVGISIVAIAVGAVGSSLAGLTDRFGRTVVVAGGLAGISLIVLFGIPNADGATAFLVLTAAEGVLAGATGVALPALVRDFSAQASRATAMGLWSLGPVLGALSVHLVAHLTQDAHNDWQFQFRITGISGLVVAAVAALWLRELTPELRNQLVVRRREQRLAELRVASGETGRAARRSVLGMDVICSSVAISLYLIFYYTQVGFFVVYLVTNFGYSSARANGLADLYWAVSAVAIMCFAAVSDRLHVRKPFMMVGALTSAAGSAIVAMLSTHSHTSYAEFGWALTLAAVGNGLTFAPWMAAHTETVERRNPGASAAGLAVWSTVNKAIVAVVLTVFALTVTAPTTLVDHGARVGAILAAHPDVARALATGAPIPSTTTASSSELAYLGAHVRQVATASHDGPEQWRLWWWVAALGQLALIPFLGVLAGRWRPRTARADLRAHDEAVAAELDLRGA